MGIVYSTSKLLARADFRVLARWRVEGQEAVPPRGPLLVVSNHLSNADPPLLIASLPRRISFMAKRGLFTKPVVGFLLRALGSYPLDRNSRDRGALKWTLQLLQEEKAVTIFPEGTRSPGGLRQGHPGVAYLALKSMAPILPVAVTGTESIGPLWRVPLPLCSMKVSIGLPFSLPTIEGELTRPLLQHLTDLIMQRIAMLLPESYRGYYRTQPSQVSERPSS
ncbi:MAG: lysophospholipid acyltransferase family protein [Dehalococcoidia bacterium]